MFKEFLKKCLKYKNLCILEETGDREKIKRISRRHGKVTEASVLLFDSKTKRTTVNEIYFNTQGYFIIQGSEKIETGKI